MEHWCGFFVRVLMWGQMLALKNLVSLSIMNTARPGRVAPCYGTRSLEFTCAAEVLEPQSVGIVGSDHGHRNNRLLAALIGRGHLNALAAKGSVQHLCKCNVGEAGHGSQRHSLSDCCWRTGSKWQSTTEIGRHEFRFHTCWFICCIANVA